MDNCDDAQTYLISPHIVQNLLLGNILLYKDNTGYAHKLKEYLFDCSLASDLLVDCGLSDYKNLNP